MPVVDIENGDDEDVAQLDHHRMFHVMDHDDPSSYIVHRYELAAVVMVGYAVPRMHSSLAHWAYGSKTHYHNIVPMVASNHMMSVQQGAADHHCNVLNASVMMDTIHFDDEVADYECDDDYCDHVVAADEVMMLDDDFASQHDSVHGICYVVHNGSTFHC